MSTSQPKVTLHWMNASQASRILWLLNELDSVKFDVVPHYRKPNMLAPEELKELHPLGKSPIVVVESEGKTKALTESGRIARYLINHFDEKNVFEVNDDEADLVNYYGEMAVSTLSIPMFMVFLMTVAEKSAPWFSRPLVKIVTGGLKNFFGLPESFKVFNLLESDLSKSADRVGKSGDIYFVGDKFTAADVMLFWHLNDMLFKTVTWEDLLDKSKYPNIQRWITQMEKRPAMMKTLEMEAEYCKGHVNPVF